MNKLTVKDLHIIQAACTEFASNTSEYLLSEVGCALPENDRVEMVKNINLCRNYILPKIEEMAKEDITEKLKNVIIEDCKLWETLNNQDKMLHSYMHLNECLNSKDSGMYQLILNGCELWYGTLAEINAIVKSMVVRIDKNDFID